MRRVRTLVSLTTVLVLSGVARDALAADLVQAMTHVWVPAATLGLTLLSAANRDHK